MLNPGSLPAATRLQSVLSLALFEEVELLTAALVHVFNNAEKWAAIDYAQF